MNKDLGKFLLDQKVLKKEDWKHFQKYLVTFRPKYLVKSDEIVIDFILKSLLPVDLFSLFYLSQLKNNKIIFNFSFYQSTSDEMNSFDAHYLAFFAENVLHNKPLLLLLQKTSPVFDNHVLTFFCEHKVEATALKKYDAKIKSFLFKVGYQNIKIEYNVKLVSTPSLEQNSLFAKKKETFEIHDDLNVTQLSTNLVENNKYVFESQIFKLETDKKQMKFNILLITDYSNSLRCFFQEETIFLNVKISELSVGDWVRVICQIKRNVSFHNELCGKIIQISKIDQPSKYVRCDQSPQKRTEIIMHTNLSAFDGLNSPNDIISKVKKFGWKSICVTDFNCVQSFPEFSKFSDPNFNVIYGLEASVIPNTFPIVLNATKNDLQSEEYVVFDLETTGLTPALDEIIEFAGVKYKSNKRIDELNFLIKPVNKISEETTKLTHISNEMLQCDGISLQEALEKIEQFIGNSTLIAHNGIAFDLPFLNLALKKNGFKKLENQLIDTLRLSWALNQDSFLHNLGAMARRYGVEYDEQAAHRALADAHFLRGIWNKILLLFDDSKNPIRNGIELNQKYDTLKFRLTARCSYPLFIYAKNQKGIKKIYQMLSSMLTKNFVRGPKLPIEELIANRADLVIVNNPIEGNLITEVLVGNDGLLSQIIDFYDFIALSPPETYSHKIQSGYLSTKDYESFIKKIINIAQSKNKKCIASSDAYYLEKWQKKFHEVLVHTKAIGGKRHRFFDIRKHVQHVPDLFLHTTQEMLDSFAFLEDQKLINEIVIDNSHYFTSLFSKVEPIIKKRSTFRNEDTDNKLKELTWKNAYKKYGKKLNPIVKERIEHELDSIVNNGYGIIYWTSYLLVDKSHQDGYLVGSRGSVGSSLVALLLNISEINPLPSHYLCNKCHYFEFASNADDGYDLVEKKCSQCGAKMFGDGHDIPFETFMGLHGDKIPDIDLNFSGLYQPKAHNYIRELFGKDYALRAGTVTTIAERTAFAFVKTYFDEIGKLGQVRETEIQRYANNLIGVKRTTGQHPGGIIIFPKELSILDFTPYNYPADDDKSTWFTTHFAFEYLHDSLLKLDVLGHDDPTMLKKLYELTNKDPRQIPNHDSRVLSLFSCLKELKINPNDILGETTGVIGIPEFGTNFVRQILRTTKPTSFADLVRISGLSHGTNVWKNNAEKLITSHNNPMHLSDVIACRDDIMIYLTKIGLSQENAFAIMESVRKGFQLTNDYVSLMREKGVPSWYISSCSKIKYLFPKAHAAAYVLMAWRIAWYKLYYPLQFYAAHFTYKIIEHDVSTILAGKNSIIEALQSLKHKYKQKYTIKPKEIELINTYEIALEMLARGIKMKPISLLKSAATEYVVDHNDNALIPPFITVPSLGDVVANSIVTARNEREFVSIEDFKQRTKITSTHLKLLMEFGVLNNLRKSAAKTLFD